jgi:hypothetical protein
MWEMSRVGTYTSLRRNRTQHLGISCFQFSEKNSSRVTRSACPGLSRLVCSIMSIVSSIALYSLQLTRSSSRRSRVALRDSTVQLVFPVEHAIVALSPLSGLRVGFHETRGSLGRGRDDTELSFPPQNPLSSLPAYLHPSTGQKCSNLSRSLKAGKLGGKYSYARGQHNTADIKGISNLKHTSTSVRTITQSEGSADV